MKSSHADVLCATSISLHHSDITSITTSIARIAVRDCTGKGKKMELIDRDEAIKRLGDAHFKNYGNAIMVIRETPTVEAIPIEFIRKVIEAYGKDAEEYHKKGQYIMSITALEKNIALGHLIEEWFKERKK